jgi:hypothetical protein
MNKIKKFKANILLNIFICLIIIVLFISCSEQKNENVSHEQDICNYNGSQIVDKQINTWYGKWFRFRKDGKITDKIYVVDYDYNRFEIGDTVYCR